MTLGSSLGIVLAVASLLVGLVFVALAVLVARRMRQILRSAEETAASVARSQAHLARRSEEGGDGA